MLGDGRPLNDKIREQNSKVNVQFAVLLTTRGDLRIGQMIYNAMSNKFRETLRPPTGMENVLFYLEDEELIQLIEEFRKGAKTNE